MNPLSSPLLTDLYELTMLQAYYERGMTDTAVFELFVRKLPPKRDFLVAAGLEQALEFIEGLSFSREELDWIAGCGHFKPAFVDELAKLRFTGEVHAMAEGTVFFQRAAAPRRRLPAQLLETRVLNLIHFQTVIASKAVRSRLAAGEGKRLIDFGLRRAHGAEAGLLAARSPTSPDSTGPRPRLPARASASPCSAPWRIRSCRRTTAKRMLSPISPPRSPESGAPRRYLRHRRGRRIAVRTTQSLKGVRLDSGELDDLSRKVRHILDVNGARSAIIFASGNLDEDAVARLVAAGAPIDSFGIGTAMTTSADQPFLDAVYKLQEYAGRRAALDRQGDLAGPQAGVPPLRPDGTAAGDVVTLHDDAQSGEALLFRVMERGLRLPQPSLEESRERCCAASRACRRRSSTRSRSPALRAAADEVDRSLDHANHSPLVGERLGFEAQRLHELEHGPVGLEHEALHRLEPAPLRGIEQRVHQGGSNPAVMLPVGDDHAEFLQLAAVGVGHVARLAHQPAVVLAHERHVAVVAHG